MAKLLKLRRGTTSQHGSFTGAEGEVTVDTDKETLVVHDGSTAGGHPVAAEDMANVSSASIAGRLSNDSIATSKIAAGALPTDVTVASANIVDGTIVNADVNTSAAIAGSKISPNFGAQNIQTTGQLQLSGSAPTILLNDENNENDFEVSNTNGTFKVRDIDAGVDRLTINSSGTAGFSGNLDVGAGIDVTGHATVSQSLTVSGTTSLGETVNITGNDPNITFVDSDNNPDFKIFANGGTFNVVDSTNTANRLVINSDGHVDIDGNTDFGAGIDVTGNITVTGTVDGVDIATKDAVFSALTSGSATLSNGVLATTQSQGDNSQKVATSAYTDTAVSNLVDSAPGALNTLNELAAAVNDDANFSTTITNNIATKMPLAGGEFTGNITCENITPDGDSSRNLGTNSTRFANVYAENLYGGGANITGIPAANLTGTAAAINGSNITNLSAANLTGTLPAIDGSNLTGITSFVSGMIILWSGAENAIPSGWVLCNGSNSTPDLRDRFVVGAGSAYSVGNTGGSSSVTLTVNQIPAHGHTIPRASGTETNFDNTGLRGGPGYYTNTAYWLTSYNTGCGQAHENIPPYYALCYIMKT